MSRVPFYNNSVELSNMWYESHKNVLRMVCMELNQSEKIDELITKVLGEKPKPKKMKDPNKPKRAKTGWMYFCDDLRPKVLKKWRSTNRKIVVGEVAKELGNKWRKISAKDKVKYQQKAVADKKRWVSEVQKYNVENNL